MYLKKKNPIYKIKVIRKKWQEKSEWKNVRSTDERRAISQSIVDLV